MRPLATALGICVVSVALFGQSAQSLQKQLESEAAKLRTWGSDAELVAAVKAQNAKRVPLKIIQTLDADWIAGKAEALVKQTTGATCSAHLRQLAGANATYGEVFVMDDQGALVCANAKTSDYWQGDEAKWQRAFNSGKGDVFIDRPRYDESASRNLAQISVPVLDGGKAIGVITVGLSLR
ncbi:MAG TPA: PDC sensor domain-containing protein [Thermoanaerobaculia bacterium]|nr:PDC sensor domain-containing protein [Thermoanaerobaculia bacterium]